ncbi:MAG: fibronectin type III domain-containing protein [Lachnospiraceae bacterium]|nr:fibronectin type III domain-containing protein [Lachnospiraceae bacterium]
MKKAVKALFMVFAVAFGLLIFTGTSKAAGTITGLQQTNARTNSITLKWDSYTGTNIRYQVEVSSDGKTFAPVDTFSVSNPTDTVSGLSSGATYYVRVVAYQDWYGSKTQVAVSAPIQASTVPVVGQVEGLTQTGATTNSISMKWNPVSGADSYSVYRYNGYSDHTLLGTTTDTSYTVSGLTASQEVRYFVIAKATTATGISGESSSFTGAYMHTAPGKVSYVAMTNYWDWSQEAKYGWNSVNYVSGYQFQLQNYKGKNLLTKETTSNYIYVKPFKKGVFTKARVRAFITINNQRYYGAWSDYDYNASAKKVTLKRTGNGKKITVKWKKIQGAAGYTVMISTKSDSGFKKVKTLGKKKTSISITKCGKKKLKKGKTYYIRVKYLTKVGNKKVASGIMGTGSI